MASTPYVGNELELFAHATNWKRYYRQRILPLFGQTVLEVGAGIGETTRHLCTGPYRRWLCVEPDSTFCETIQAKILSGDLPACCSVYNGTTESLPEDGTPFDTILYIDVLEHLEDDRAELRRASRLLDDDGAILVVAPAHNFLFSPFDSQVGHHRRYDRKRLHSACPDELTIERMEYLDSVGMLASLANRCLMKKSTPSLRQIQLWDKAMVPISRKIDRLFLHRLGKSVLAVFRKTGGIS